MRSWVQPIVARWPEPSRAAPTRSAGPAVMMGSVLLIGQIVTGAAAIDTWPVAVFPRFSSRVTDYETQGQRLTLVLEKAGADEEIDVGYILRGSSGKARVNKLMQKISRLPKNNQKLREASGELVSSLQAMGAPVEAGEQLILYKETWDLFPVEGQGKVRRKVVRRFEVRSDLTLARAD